MTMKRIKLYFTGWAAVMALFISSSALTSCNDDIADDDLYTYKAEMLSDWLRNNEDFSEFAAIVERAGKMDLFSTYGTYTCFAPKSRDILRLFGVFFKSGNTGFKLVVSSLRPVLHGGVSLSLTVDEEFDFIHYFRVSEKHCADDHHQHNADNDPCKNRA